MINPTKEELYLIWYLVRENEYDDSKYHDVQSVLQDMFKGKKLHNIELLVSRLDHLGYIDVLDYKDSFQSRINEQGLQYYEENSSLFESIRLDSAKKDFTEEIAPEIIEGQVFNEEEQEVFNEEYDEIFRKRGYLNISKLSDEVLLFLLEKRKSNPSLKFWLKNKRGNNLNDGQWFEGSGYIFVGFSQIKDINHRSIGFLIARDKNKNKTQCKIEICYKKETRTDFIKCYEEIGNSYSSIFDPEIRIITIDIKNKSWKDAVDSFLEKDKPRIDRIFNTSGLSQEIEIPDEKFSKMLSNTLRVREDLGYGEIDVDFPKIQKKSDIEDKSTNFDTDADIIADSLATKDELGHKELIEVLFGKINRLWGKLTKHESYTILLNGEWGSGKSSMLHYLEEMLTEDHWYVVQYNAWKNQRFEDPWWILVNKVSQEVPSSSNIAGSNHLSESHEYWKLKQSNSITYMGAIVTSVLLMIGFKYKVFGDDLAFYASILALVASVSVTVNGVLKNIFKKKSLTELQMKTANDPLEPYKKRFEEVVKHKKVAIFIDDLDRCEVDATVKLLEGVQTLFKDTKVLYVIAADGQWVSNCFDKKYKDFESMVPAGQTIGNQFLQKTFQLILDVPKLSKEKIEQYVKLKLNRTNKEEEHVEIAYDIEEIKAEKSISKLSEYTKKGDAKSRKAATEQIEHVIEKDAPELEHAIIEFHKDNELPLNPRQIKRLINLYTMKMQELNNNLVLDQLTSEQVLKYIVFATEYSKYNYELNSGTTEDFRKTHPEIVELIKPLTPELIKEYL